MLKRKKYPLMLPVDWLFQSKMDSEYLEYKLMAYFQKVSKLYEEFKVYPMFSELCLHTANIMILKDKNSMMYLDQNYFYCDAEIHLEDLKYKPAPEMSKEDMLEYHKILRFSSEKLNIYFQMTTFLWTTVFESIELKLLTPNSYLNSNKGYFFIDHNGSRYIIRYEMEDIYSKVKIKVVHTYDDYTQDIFDVIRKLAKRKKIDNTPIFEIKCKDMFPLEETLIPIAKRKIVSYIKQNQKKVNLLVL